MKKIAFSLFAVLTMALVSFTAEAQYVRGDVDQDGTVTVGDVASLIDYLLNGTWNDDPVTPPEEHEWVDLGLPSGTLWATCNIGANAPEEYGDYFAWGETKPKSFYSFSTYKWSSGNYNTLTKYCNNSEYGEVDGKTKLELEDDAAYVNWGPSWRIPTTNQLAELCTNCTHADTTMNNVKGVLVTGPNGNTMFMPLAGCREDSLLHGDNLMGYYWSDELISTTSYAAFYFNLSSWRYWFGYRRANGFTVRAVYMPQD